MKPRIVLGMGTGHCGLDLLADILARQSGSRVTFEQQPLLPWTPRSDRPGLVERFQRWRAAEGTDLIGDVAWSYLLYAEKAIAIEPDVRLVCLECPKDEVVAGFREEVVAGRPLPVNHWAKIPASGWTHDPILTPTFPHYDTSELLEGISLYCKKYHNRAIDLSCQFPDHFRIFNTSELTTAAGVRSLLDFVGLPRTSQVMAVGVPMDEEPSHQLAVEPSPLPMMDPRRCVVLVPFAGFIHQDCESALKELERRGYPVRRVGGFAAIDQARNHLATVALMEGFAETMWIDSDIGFDPDAVETLRAWNKPIVCGIYPQKGKRLLACELLPGTSRLTFGAEGGLVEIQYAAAGFLHIRREAYLAVQSALDIPTCNHRFGQPMIPFFHPLIRQIDDGYWYLAEDYSFSERPPRRAVDLCRHVDPSLARRSLSL